MRAIRLRRWQTEPELVEIDVPVPAPGEVLLRVDAAGLCHSDLHLSEWPEGTLPYELPFTLGHETAGTVAALGAGVREVSEGDRVVVHSRWGCGSCWSCLRGMENRCQRPSAELGGDGGGVGRDGGLADYMVVPSPRYLVAIDGLDPAQAAPLSDAALTPYHAITRASCQLRPGAVAVVIGVGGVGLMAVQLLRALSPVRIVAVDVRDDALALASAAGADATINAADLTAAQLCDEVGPRGAALVLDCVGSDATLSLAAGAVAIGGEVSYVGRAGGSLPVAPGRLPLECSVTIPSWGTIAELIEVVALARSGAIRTEVELFTLDQAVDAYRRLARGQIRGRAVVLPAAGA